jgi:predicted acylesterase/phospholipase RssA
LTPHYYSPSFSHAFLSSEPWQRMFDHIFGRRDVKQQLFDAKDKLRFYMTRSDVRTGQLECVTNNPQPRKVNRVTFHNQLAFAQTPEEYLAQLKVAVFSSMDLPPLFPYVEDEERDKLYEDGGIIDNLPLSFAAVEQCDVIFVLPLNSDFEAEPNRNSVLMRLNRVLDVQQGVLERHSFKLLYLYNELASLRDRVNELEARAGGVAGPGDAASDRPDPSDYAMRRKHRVIRIVAVCPDKEFVRSTLNTRDLWNRKGAETAFNVMARATGDVLLEFDANADPTEVGVALVRRSGRYRWDYDF